jgi:hypothetical protein
MGRHAVNAIQDIHPCNLEAESNRKEELDGDHVEDSSLCFFCSWRGQNGKPTDFSGL